MWSRASLLGLLFAIWQRTLGARSEIDIRANPQATPDFGRLGLSHNWHSHLGDIIVGQIYHVTTIRFWVSV